MRITLLPSADSAKLTDTLREMLVTHGLTTASRGERATDIVITRDGSQVTDADRQLVLQWASHWAHAAAITVSDLIDLNSPS